MIVTAIILMWLQLYWALVPVWLHGEYYAYGWFVPPLAFAFAWRRNGMTVGAPFPSDGEPVIHWAAAVGLLALLLWVPLFRAIESADPGWRVPLLAHAAVVVVITHLLLARIKGKRFSWSMLPVTLFALTAVPYPGGLENTLIRKLTGSVISVTSEAFLLAGKPVEILGERLALGDEVVAVTEGCSGIRSFQSLVMAALFFGELLLLGWWKRLILLGIGGSCALFVNAGRAWWLASTQFSEGPEAAAAIHDMVGHVAFLVSAGILFGAAWLLSWKRSAGRVVVRRVATGH